MGSDAFCKQRVRSDGSGNGSINCGRWGRPPRTRARRARPHILSPRARVPAAPAGRPFGGRDHADPRLPLLRGAHVGIGVRLVPVPAHRLQPDVGRRFRRPLDIPGGRCLVSPESRPIPQLRRPLRPRRAARVQRLFPAVPGRLQGAGRGANLEWAVRAHGARLEPLGARARQPGAQPGLRPLRRHHRDRPLVRPAVHEYPPHPHERAGGVRPRVPVRAGPTGAPQRLRRRAGGRRGGARARPVRLARVG
jgi:hypothetical protein